MNFIESTKHGFTKLSSSRTLRALNFNRLNNISKLTLSSTLLSVQYVLYVRDYVNYFVQYDRAPIRVPMAHCTLSYYRNSRYWFLVSAVYFVSVL